MRVGDGGNRIHRGHPHFWMLNTAAPPSFTSRVATATTALAARASSKRSPGRGDDRVRADRWLQSRTMHSCEAAGPHPRNASAIGATVTCHPMFREACQSRSLSKRRNREVHVRGPSSPHSHMHLTSVLGGPAGKRRDMGGDRYAHAARRLNVVLEGLPSGRVRVPAEPARARSAWNSEVRSEFSGRATSRC